MPKHPKAGMPVKIANGKFKGQYYYVVDYLVNLYQGKNMKRILTSFHPNVEAELKSRGCSVDDKIVWGKLYPSMRFLCLHDDELVVDMKLIEGGDAPLELPPNVESLSKKRKPKPVKKEKGDDPGTAS